MKFSKEIWEILHYAGLCKVIKEYIQLEKAAQKKDSNKLKIPTCINIPKVKKTA